jgi:hypothetical protein
MAPRLRRALIAVVGLSFLALLTWAAHGPRLRPSDVKVAGFEDMHGVVKSPLPATEVESLVTAVNGTWRIPYFGSRACYPMMGTSLDIVLRDGDTLRFMRVWECPNRASASLMDVSLDDRSFGTLYAPQLVRAFVHLATAGG